VKQNCSAAASWFKSINN